MAFFEQKEGLLTERIDWAFRESHTIGAHWHNEYELVYVLRGTIIIGVDFETRKLKQGDIAVYHAGQIHFLDANTEEGSLTLIMIYHPDYIPNVASNRSYRSPFIDEEARKQGIIPEDQLAWLYDCIERIGQETDLRKPYTLELVISCLSIITVILNRYFTKENLSYPAKGNTLSIAQQAITYINGNSEFDLTLELVAHHLSVSPHYLSRLFKRATGQTFKAYLNGIRVRRAYNQIMNTDRSILDIALECGFNSVRTFNRVFKSQYNKTPKEVRNEL